MALTWGDTTTAGGFYTGDQHKVDVSPILRTLFVKDTAFTARIPFKGEATDIEHKWYEAELTPQSFTAAYISATNTLTISDPSSTSDVLKRVRKYAVVRPADNTDLYLQFSSDPVTGANTVTVYSGTNADVSSTTWELVSLPHADEDDPTDSMVDFDSVRKNYTQVFERSVDITKTAQGIELYPKTFGEKWFNERVKRQTMQLKIEMDRVAVTGVASSSANNARRTLAGFIQQVRDPDLDGTNEDETVVDASSATISEDLLNTLAKTVYDRGGFDGQAKPYLVCSSTQMKNLAALNESIRRADISDKTVGYKVESFVTSIGPEIPIVVDRWMPSNIIALVDYSRIAWTPLKGDKLALRDVNLSNPRIKKVQLSGQYTLVVEHADRAHGLITNLAT